MKKASAYKMVAIFLAIFILADVLILFTCVHNVLLNNDQLVKKPESLYILFLLLPIFIIFYLINNLLSLKKQVEKTITSDKLENTVIKESRKTETRKEDDDGQVIMAEQSYDINQYIKKIIPRVTSSTTHEKFTEKLLSNLAKEFEIIEGLFYLKTKGNIFTISGLYAYFSDEKPKDFKEGEGIDGQVIKNRKTLNIKNVPEGYVHVLSGLGEGTPNHMLIVPILLNEQPLGLLELASFKEFDTLTENILTELSHHIGENLTTIQKAEKK